MTVYCSLHKLKQDVSRVYGTLDAITDHVESTAVFMARDHGWYL